MIAYQDLKNLAELRLKEAKVLYQNRMYDGAAYLCGYVVELSLKARICKVLDIPEYPDEGEHKPIFSTHKFDQLKLLAGLQEKITLRHKRLFTNWSLLTTWKPESRYSPEGTYSGQDIRKLLRALENPGWGFFSWIKRIW